jgi:hypothetical protein
MTPKEKAKEIFDKYYLKTKSGMDKDFGWVCISLNKGMAKQCALIAVDEIIKSMSRYDDLIEEDLKREFGIEFFSSELQNMDGDFRYWQQVKQEIEKL